MNIHVSKEIQDKWKSLEFRGHSWENNNLTWIKAKYKVLGVTWFFCFEKDCIVDRETYELFTNEK